MKKIFKLNISIICVICLIAGIVGCFAVDGALNNLTAEASPSVAPEITGSPAPLVPTEAPTSAAPLAEVPMYVNHIKVGNIYKLDGTTYTPIRAFIEAIGEQADLAWDAENNLATLKTDTLNLTATVGNKYFTANDRCLYVPNGVLIIDGAVSLPVRELAKVFGAIVEWDEPTSSVSVRADEPVVFASAEETYNKDDLYWLSRLINAEAGNQLFDGKIGVGNVVTNRVADPTCPKTIYGVIFDSKYGVQFSVTENGGIYAEPNEESVVAAKICLEGYNVVGNSIYFVNPTIGTSSWFASTRAFVSTIGEHDFYA
ncbi:MAG: cell wall hydrolase [Oscillospiraceae bacterium]